MLSFYVKFRTDRKTDRQTDTGKTMCPQSFDAEEKSCDPKYMWMYVNPFPNNKF